MSSFPVFTVSHASKILKVFQEILNDIEDVRHNTIVSSCSHQVNDYYGDFDFSSDSDSELLL